MNLMDLLSAEQSNAPTAIVAPFYDPLRQPREPQDNENSVYYLPCTMSTLQKDMTEAVVQIFADVLESLILMLKQRTSINTLVEDSSLNKNLVQLNFEVSLMYDLLQTISLHPSLLVDHFISKGLLLLSPKDRLLDLSGKMRVFNELIDVLSARQENGHLSSDYNLLVITRSGKELDLIEGLIVGKKIHYHSYSRGKLYEEKQPVLRYRKETSAEESPGSETRRRRRQQRRISAKSRGSPKVVLHLITSDQVYNSYSSTSTLDLIFSFDPLLDLSNPGLDLLRRNNKSSLGLMATTQRETPVLIPVQIFSIEHINQVVSFPSASFSNSHDEASRKLKVLKSFIINRSHLFIMQDQDDLVPSYSKVFQRLSEWLESWDKMNLPTSLCTLDRFTEKMALEIDDKMVTQSLKENHLNAMSAVFLPVSGSESNGKTKAKHENLQTMTYNTLKKELSLFLNERADEVEGLIEEGLSTVLPDLRKIEASRQAEIDSYEDQIGENYRKLRKLNESLITLDKKFNRVESENQNLQAQHAELKTLLAHLNDVIANKDEEEIKSLIQNQSGIVDELVAEKSRLQEGYSSLVEASECLREEYQVKSAEAVKLTNRLEKSKVKKKALAYKLQGPGMRQLPSLARNDEISVQERKLRRILEESQFINNLFSSRLDRLVKDRSSSMEYSASLSTGRGNNRGSRASTPLQFN